MLAAAVALGVATLAAVPVAAAPAPAGSGLAILTPQPGLIVRTSGLDAAQRVSIPAAIMVGPALRQVSVRLNGRLVPSVHGPGEALLAHLDAAEACARG